MKLEAVPTKKYLAVTLAAVTFLASPQAATACSPTAVIFVADSPQAEKRLRLRHEKEVAKWRKEQKKKFQSDIRAGRVDAAELLAAILVPNVRRSWSDASGCSVGGGAHDPLMPWGSLAAQWMTGTEFEGLRAEDLKYRANYPKEDAFNKECNEEFRATFAVRLSDTLSQRRLIRDCLDLCSGYPVQKFSGEPRLTRPVFPSNKSETWRSEFSTRYSELVQQLEAFWNVRESDLGKLSKLCPAALAATEIDRSKFLENLRARDKIAQRYAELARQNRSLKVD